MTTLRTLYPKTGPVMLRPISIKDLDFVKGRKKAVEDYLESVKKLSTRAFTPESAKETQEKGTEGTKQWDGVEPKYIRPGQELA
jgi:hypothetical protein